MAVPPLAGNATLWVAFALPCLVLLALDLGLFLRAKGEPSLRESLAWVGIWAALATAFGLALTRSLGAEKGLAFATAYVVEQALSVDNLFVFLLVFRELLVPPAAQKRALAWGVLGALVLRVAMLAAGASFLAHFHALGWALGGLLVVLGVRAAMKLRKPPVEAPAEGDRPSAARRALGRFLPIHDRFDEDRFTTEVGGRPHATPLLLAVGTILCADVVFALDSIPAVLGVTTDAIIIIPSNVFAVLALRSMFFLVQGLLARLRYLPHGLAAVLVVVGAKMLLGSVVAIATWVSLASILLVLGVAVVASLLQPSSSGEPIC